MKKKKKSIQMLLPSYIKKIKEEESKLLRFFII